MAHLIDKDALVAEIERLRDEALTRQHNLERIGQVTSIDEQVAFNLNKVLSFIDTLEVKEVDLEKEIDNYLLTYWNEEREKFLHPFLKKMCVHFFELGITASNKV